MAYAAVISLKHTIGSFTNPSNPQIPKPVYEELKLLGDLFNRSDGGSNNLNSGVIDELDAEIRDAVWKLEDVLQFHVFHHSLRPPDGLGDVHPADEGIEQAIGSFLKTVRKSRVRYNRELDNPSQGERDGPGSPLDAVSGERSTMVGSSDQFEKIRDELLEDGQPDLITISLFGMAGIGKTHLATEIFQLPGITEHFDLRLWVSLGPKHQIENVLMDIDAQIERQLGNHYSKGDTSSLPVYIYQNLIGRRYIIVLDDIWSREAWDSLKMWFPSHKNGSRLLMTTRLEEVATYPTKSRLHKMHLLNNDDSWNLLCENMFGEERCPYQLEKAGRKIAEHCEGLPLLIITIANLLSRVERTLEDWNEVAMIKRHAIFTDAYHIISKVLLLSFEYLPQYLKACFLYMGAFPHNYEIPIPKLIKLWAVEDLLEPNKSQNIEDFAMECLQKLVSQSLVIVSGHSPIDTIKASKLHSTYWHLCVIEARKNKFLHVLDCWDDIFNVSIETQRRLTVQNNVLFGIKEVYDSMAAALTARSLLCTGPYLQYPVPICFDMLLLKVLDALAVRFCEFPDEVLKLSQLKYLALTHYGDLPSIISKLQNLQNLIVCQHHHIQLKRDSPCLPKEIWEMQELRHLRVMGSILPDPSEGAQLPNLLTLHMKGKSCTEEFFRSIPKLKKLGITIELRPRSAEILSCFQHISFLQELESLKCVVVNPRLRSQVVAPPDSFPTSLKKLSLNGLGYSWEYISAIGSLPNLQVLKLRRSAFRGPEWRTEVEEFQRLEYLLLEDMDLVHWTIDEDDDDCFPSLKHLIIRHCYKLTEIPSQIGRITTIETIEVVDSCPSVGNSVLQIQQEEEENGNLCLQAPISSSWNL